MWSISGSVAIRLPVCVSNVSADEDLHFVKLLERGHPCLTSMRLAYITRSTCVHKRWCMRVIRVGYASSSLSLMWTCSAVAVRTASVIYESKRRLADAGKFLLSRYHPAKRAQHAGFRDGFDDVHLARASSSAFLSVAPVGRGLWFRQLYPMM